MEYIGRLINKDHATVIWALKYNAVNILYNKRYTEAIQKINKHRSTSMHKLKYTTRTLTFTEYVDVYYPEWSAPQKELRIEYKGYLIGKQNQ